MSQNTLWLEKYRPMILSDVIGNQEIISKLQSLKQ